MKILKILIYSISFLFLFSCTSKTNDCDTESLFPELEAAMEKGERMMNIPEWVTEYRRKCLCLDDMDACERVDEYFKQQERYMRDEIKRIEHNSKYY